MNKGTKVIHEIHGGGTVVEVNGSSVKVQFTSGVKLEVDASELQTPLYS